MGLFYSSEAVGVYSTSSALMAQSENPKAEIVMHSIMSNKNLVDTFISSTLGGMGLKARSLYNYARDSYTLGVPEIVTINGEGTFTPVLSSIVSGIIGQDVIYAVIVNLTPLRAITPWLIANRGYKPEENRIAIPPFIIPDWDADVIYITSAVLEGGLIRVGYKYSMGEDYEHNPLFGYTHEHVPVPGGMAIGEDYCIAKYMSGTQEAYWYYRISSGAIPELTNNAGEYGISTYMPVVPLRKDNIDKTGPDNEATDLYQTSKRMLGKMKIDIDLLGSLLNDNPNIADIDNAYIMFGISALSETPEGIKYLAEYFEMLGEMAEYNEEAAPEEVEKFNIFATNNITGTGNPPLGFEEDGFSITIAFNYVEVEEYPGILAAPMVETEAITETVDITVTDESGPIDYNVYDKSRISYLIPVGGNTIRKVTVVGLMHKTSNIYDGEDYKITAYQIIDDPETYRIVVPIYYSIAHEMTIMERNNLFVEAPQIVITSYEVQSLAWYEQRWFVAVVIVIVAIISAFSFSYWLNGLSVAWAAAVTAGVTAGLLSVAWYLLKSVIIAFVVSEVANWAMEEYGDENMLIAAAILIIAAMFAKYYSGTTAGSLLTMTSQYCLAASSAILSARASFLEDEISAVTDEMDALESTYEDLYEDLAAQMEELTSTSLIDPLLLPSLQKPMNITTEDPEGFFNRTIHTGNIGVLSLDMIELYHDSMLKLPKPHNNGIIS